MARFVNGWYRCERKLAFGEIARRGPNYFFIWHRILSMANIEESRSPVMLSGQAFRLKPGELITSLSELSGGFMSIMAVHRILDFLQKTLSIRYMSVNQGTLITVCNWSYYQGSFKETLNERDMNVKPTLNGREHIEQVTINNKQEQYNTTTPVVGATPGVVALESLDSLLSLIEEKRIDAWLTLYDRDEAFLRRESLRAWNYYDNNPKKKPKSKRGWVNALGSWYERAWTYRANNLAGKKEVGDKDSLDDHLSKLKERFLRNDTNNS